MLSILTWWRCVFINERKVPCEKSVGYTFYYWERDAHYSIVEEQVLFRQPLTLWTSKQDLLHISEPDLLEDSFTQSSLCRPTASYLHASSPQIYPINPEEVIRLTVSACSQRTYTLEWPCSATALLLRQNQSNMKAELLFSLAWPCINLYDHPIDLMTSHSWC